MLDSKQREIAETIFDRNQRRDGNQRCFGAGGGPARGRHQEHAPLEGAKTVAGPDQNGQIRSVK
jgi:hypothetical protein